MTFSILCFCNGIFNDLRVIKLICDAVVTCIYRLNSFEKYYSQWGYNSLINRAGLVVCFFVLYPLSFEKI